MALTPFSSRILLDTGISMGDEGKGRLIPEVIRELQTATGSNHPVAVVIKVNGGANSGHTSGGLKLNLYPAGVVETSVGCLAIGSGVVADPHKFVWEGAYIESAGYEVRERLLIDERTMVSDISHRLLDLAWEHYRSSGLGQDKRGSTARGISPAYSDETLQFAIHYAEFQQRRDSFEKRLQQRIQRTLKTIFHVCEVTPGQLLEFLQQLSAADLRAHQGLVDAGIQRAQDFDLTRFWDEQKQTLNAEAIAAAYWETGSSLRNQIGDVRERIRAELEAGNYVIGEFGQAFWLDKRFGFSPNVTASHTLPAEFFLSTGTPLQPAHVFGVCKAYDTKVGTHVFICQFPPKHPLGQRLSRIEFGTTTGRQRMVGWFDAVEKGDAIRYGGCDDLVINKLDALSYGGDWQSGGKLLICTGYELPDGTVLRHVPRDMHTHRLCKPVYQEVDGWNEEISTARSFSDLPQNAKSYVATMVAATFRVAFGDDEKAWPEALPNVRYIGVGPDPDQIIADVPATRALLLLA